MENKLKTSVDFKEEVKKMGYVKARQLMKKLQIKDRLASIKEKEDSNVVIRRAQRLAEAIKLSDALGEPNAEQPIDKIITSTNRRVPHATSMTQEEYDIMVDNDTAVRRSILSRDLTIAQGGIDTLPDGLGDTLFLQMTYLTSMILPNNKIFSFLTHKMPQLSMIHFRYLTDLNLSSNKIVNLPGDIGQLKSLTSLNLCQNNIFRLPANIRLLSCLTELDLSRNNFGDLGDDLAYCARLSTLNLSQNLFRSIPVSLITMSSLTSLNMSLNMFFHMAVTPKFLKVEDMWVKTLDHTDGKDLFVNALTKERVKDMYQYDGAGVQRMQGLHSYVAPSHKLMYRKRRMWLSICKVPEWEAADDIETGWIFYRNNISGETQWDMPLEVDTFGEADKLEVLNLSNNSMKSMCNSLCRMTHLRRIMVQKNRLHSLPAEIGNLLELEYLNVSDNELKLFPPSLVQCVSLREIHCQGNQIIRLPDLIGTLPALEKIDASANRLKVIPPSLGYSKLWREYAFQDNPLEDPPMSEVLLGLERLKWYLRQRYMIIERGMPPPMIFNQISIMHEVTVLKPELMMRVRHMVEINERNGPLENILNLQLLGLTEIPKEIVLYKDIKMLRLDYNNKIEIDRIDGLPDSFCGLRMLSIRACNLSFFPENCTILKRIQNLTLEENLLESLPKKFGQLRTLKELNIAKNRLYSLPEKLHGLTSLKSLNLENNFLERLPESLGKLKTITTLNISKNRLLELPQNICDMKSLKKLNIERNDLLSLPIGLSEMRLLELKIGHNRIEGLRDDFFSGLLGQTIKLFSCPENNLSELPTSLCEIDPNGFLDAELNPLYSPPPGLLSEELVVIQNYLRVRSIRINEIEELLTEEDFTFSRESASPFASEVLEDGTGYLTPYDLSEFDRAIDEYVNGDFFKCPASGFEIVNNLADLRDKRESDLYETILNTIDHVLDKVSKDSSARFSVAVYNKSTRPWGRKGEMATVHVVSWDAFLNPAPRSSYHPEGRSALIDFVRDALPPMPFPLTTELVLDSVNLFSSPYGQVAAIEEIEYSKCDCVEEKKGRVRASMHKPCRKASLVLLSSIYTPEEATRREEEDEIFMDIFEEIEEQVRFWVQTDEGKVFHKKICKQRRAELVEEISLREEMLMGEQVKLKAANTERLKVLTRKEMFEKTPDDFPSHEISSATDAIKLMSDAENKIDRINKKIIALTATIKNCEKMTQINNVEWRKIAIEDLVQKYCYLAHAERVKDFRRYAIDNNLRRPWDGLDGVLFEEWKNKRVATVQIEGGENQAAKQEDEEVEEGKRDLRTETDYNWDDTSNMKQYELDVYDKYKRSKTFFGMMSSMFNAATKAAGNIASSV